MNVRVNAYENDKGSVFVVVQRDNEKPIFINQALLKYALEHRKKILKKGE